MQFTLIEKVVAYDLSVDGMCLQRDCVKVTNKLSRWATAAGLVTRTGSFCNHTLSHKVITAEKKTQDYSKESVRRKKEWFTCKLQEV